MSVSGITSLVSSYVQKVTGGAATAQGATTPASAAQEASESTATTTREAQHGDPVARLKLKHAKAKEQQAEATQAPASGPTASASGKGELVDHKA